nr:hypothetical protein [Tanacetum cinerariifolium]
MFLYLGQLQNQLGKDEFQEDKSMAAYWVLNNQFQKFIDWQYFLNYDSEMTKMLFAEYIGIKVKQFRETLLLHMGNVNKSVAERTCHKRQYDRRMNEGHMKSRESKAVSSKALDASLVVTECSGTKLDEHITSSSSGTYITHVVDADIRPVNGQEPSAEVHLTTQHNVFANEQQHTDQSEPSYGTYLLEKVNSNTTLDSTNMCHREGEIDQDAEQDQTAGLRWIPTGKMFTDCTTKDDSECIALHRQMASADNTLGPVPQRKERCMPHSRLVPQPPSPTPNVPPTKNDWDTLFCPMFVEYFNPSPSVAQPVLVAVIREPIFSTSTPSSTRIDQDTPSTSTSQAIKEVLSHVIPTSVKEDDHGIEVAHIDNDL